MPSFELNAQEKQELLDRFLRYVKVHTRSSETSDTFPSTACQWDLLRMLEGELKDLGLSEIELDEHGYLFASLPSNLPEGRSAPVFGLLAHVDTYTGTNGENVKPQVISYAGGDIALPGDPNQVIRAAENPQLEQCIGKTLITTDGTTLLGADDKAGIAEIMTLLDYLRRRPEIPRGKVRVGFTPDEETGCGTKYFDVARFGAVAAYTFDGAGVGEIESETFSGDSAMVTVTGFDVHPGKAKGKMINAIRATAWLVERLPAGHLPESTEKRESYLHPYVINGEVGQVSLKFIVRAFDEEGLQEREGELKALARETEAAFPGVRVDVAIQESYRNMKVVLDKHPEVVNRAMEASRRAGVEPTLSYIRGGTDGSQLSFKGLPTPNIFDGSMNYHGFHEWTCLDWMAKSVETGLHLVQLWREQGAPGGTSG
jgi:tripeptide aminopeptidase